MSPYNDREIVIGQGTCGVEIQKQLPGEGSHLDVVFVAVGGGGLIAGIAAYLKQRAAAAGKKPPLVIGCQPTNSAVMHFSVQAGEIVSMKSMPTLSDGTAGGIEKGSITLPYAKQFVDEFELVSEDEIAEAMALLLATESITVEGAAGALL